MSGLELVTEDGQSPAVLGRGGGWQLGIMIVADTFGELRAAAPSRCGPLLLRLGDRVDLLTGVDELTLLPTPDHPHRPVDVAPPPEAPMPTRPPSIQRRATAPRGSGCPGAGVRPPWS